MTSPLSSPRYEAHRYVQGILQFTFHACGKLVEESGIFTVIISLPRQRAGPSTIPEPTPCTLRVFDTAHFTYHLFPLALLSFPGLFFAPPFIFLLEKPLKSPLDMASPLFANRFFPPKPNFASFFWRLFGPCRSFLDGLEEAISSSTATSKRSASFVASVSAPWRSVTKKVS